jgi:hypothetical protein
MQKALLSVAQRTELLAQCDRALLRDYGLDVTVEDTNACVCGLTMNHCLRFVFLKTALDLHLFIQNSLDSFSYTDLFSQHSPNRCTHPS